MSKDHGMIFSPPMVKALIAGRKGQTRRLLRAGVTVPPEPAMDNFKDEPRHSMPYLDAYCGEKKTIANPRGMGPQWAWWTRDDRPGELFKVDYVPGDRIWVRETWQVRGLAWGKPISESRIAAPSAWHYRATDDGQWKDYWGKWRPAIHMPRWASRITLTITDVRVQKLQEITEEDAIAEGLIKAAGRYVVEQGQQYFGGNYSTARQCYSHLWDSLHGDPGKRWKDNPFVVALTFSTELRNIDSPALEPARQQVPA